MRRIYHSFISDYIGKNKLSLDVETCRNLPKGLFHDHDYTELVIVADGKATHLVEDCEDNVSIGDVLVIQPGYLHAYDKFSNFRVLNILYKREELSLPQLDRHTLPLFEILFPDKKTFDVNAMAKPVMHLRPDDLKNIMIMIDRLQKECKGVLPGNLYLSLSIFMDITIELGRLSDYEIPRRKISFQIGEAIGFINRNYKNKIPINNLARLSKMSHRNFFRQFKLNVGKSPLEYIIELRLKEARKLLIYSDDTISEIAMHCGFYDSNYFCRIFRQVMKTSPSLYRIEHCRQSLTKR